jgi:hypothetical protein
VIVGSLCTCLEQRGCFDEADAWRRKWLGAVRKRDGPESATFAAELATQAGDMLRGHRHAGAESLLRECLTILEKKQPGAWMTFHARSLLGDALLGQARYDDAEPLLVQGYEGLKAREGQIPRLYARYRITEAGRRIVRLYEAWGRAGQAAEWRAMIPGSGDVHP